MRQFLTILFFLFVSISYGYNIYVLSDTTQKINVQLSHYCDSSGVMTIEEIQQYNFKKDKSDVVNLAYTTYNHWFAFSVFTANTNAPFFLQITNPLLDSIEVYFIQNGKIISSIQTGDFHIYKIREYDHPEYIFKIPHSNDFVTDVYIKLRTDIGLLAPMQIISEKELIAESNSLSWLTGLYYGAILVIFLYNIFLYLSLRDKSYLYYTMYLLAYGLSLLNFDGYMFKYFTHSYPLINNFLLYLFIYLATIFGTLFAISFLDLKQTWRFGYNMILVPLICVIVCMLLLVIYTNITFHDITSSILAAISSLIGIIIGIVAWLRGFPSARYYFFAYTFMLAGIIVFVLKDMALLPSNNITEYVMHFGSGIEMVLLSLGLANKYNKLKKANEEAQEKIIENLKEIQTLQDKTNRELEEKVIQRTQEIQQQKILIEEKQKEIVDSINYARRIQFSLLANKDIIERNTLESFIIFKPKDIVSGDFYWASESNNAFYLACCDCTGHGVPGAFMSILNMSFLNQAVNEKGIDAPDKILNHVRTQITDRVELGNDGMDAILIKIKENSLHYAAAVNKPILVRNNELIELAADKMPVGKSHFTNSFNLYEQPIQKGDIYYFYTDGFADQFGGDKGKKLKSTRLKELLLSNSHKNLNNQKEVLSDFFEKWKGENEQVDDVCLIGIKF